jgi:hypothetical protein
MGNFVDGNSISITLPSPAAPQGFEGDWNDGVFTNLNDTEALVTDKFNATMEVASNMLESLTGSSGYLEQLSNIIDEINVPDIVYSPVVVPDFSVSGVSAPVFDSGSLDLVFPSFSASSPVLLAIPAVDLSALEPAELPAEIATAISWIEQPHNAELYSILLTRILNDLQNGATGLNPIVEQEIYDRALARQVIADTKAEQEIFDSFASRGFPLPPGALAGRLQEQVNESARMMLEVNGKILIEQADLAQKNSQFVIQVAKDLEAVLRDFTNKVNDRSLDYEKAVAANVITIYAENIKAYIAAAEANKMYVEVQVENLKAIVEYNKGLVASYAAEAEAFGAVIDGKSKKNSAITDVYKSEIAGYEVESRVLTENQKAIIEGYKLKIQNAQAELSAAIAEVDAAVKGYTAEYGLREKVAEALTNVASQTIASAYGAVNASAGISFNGGMSKSESYGHNESRSESWGHSESISGNLSVSSSLSNDLKESHDYQEK